MHGKLHHRLFRAAIVMGLVCLLVLPYRPAQAMTPPPPPNILYEIAHAQEVVVVECIAARAEPFDQPISGIKQINYLTFKVLESWRGTRTDNVIVGIPSYQAGPVGIPDPKKAVLYIQAPGITDGKADPAKPVMYFYNYGLHWIENPEKPRDVTSRKIQKQMVQAYKEPPNLTPEMRNNWFQVHFNPEVIKVLADLITSSKDADTRQYVALLLMDCYPTDSVGPSVLPLFQDSDPLIARGAAKFVVKRKYLPGLEPLRLYYVNNPAGDEKAGLVEFFALNRIQTVIDTFPKDKRAAMHEKLNPDKKFSPNVDLSFSFGIDPDGTIKSLASQKLSGINEEIQTQFLDWLKAHLENAALAPKEIRFRLQVNIIEYQVVIKCFSP